MCLFAQVGVGAGLLVEIVDGNHAQRDPGAAAQATRLLTEALHCFLAHPEVLPAIQRIDPKFHPHAIEQLSAHEMALALQAIGVSSRQQIPDEQLLPGMRQQLQTLTEEMRRCIIRHHPRVQPGQRVDLQAAVRPPRQLS